MRINSIAKQLYTLSATPVTSSFLGAITKVSIITTILIYNHPHVVYKHIRLMARKADYGGYKQR